MPYRSWCKFCVAGKADADPHKHQEEERESSVPVVSMDYCFMSDKRDANDDEEEEGEEQEKAKGMPILVMKDRKHKYVFASVVPRKGADPYAVRRVGQDLVAILGYKRVVIKSDQEPAIKKLKEAVRFEHALEIPVEESPAYDSSSNAPAESTIKRVQGQIRTVWAQLESRLGGECTNSNLLPWLVRHSGATLSRFQVGNDGQTAHRRLRGRDFNRAITEFGECVWYKHPRWKKEGKLLVRWSDGVFLGVREESGEVLIGTRDGVLKARSFKRKGSLEER